ncbi:uncharacterized protein LOC126655767 isoform X2 [Mercurialis annua]|uniref:uncharacterized protein LOC126655767 isoform X2 n=1 Tax=Mercurialis annua TaxID=3986 RepID=UPI00215F68C5|nr:uncharacterized protein LOC126655767 isoform X2 [Mercurialis annua]
MMFTDKWVREVSAAKRNDGSHRVSTGQGNFGLPPAKFQSGFMASDKFPVSRGVRGSGSDMDISSDSEDEVYGDQYSLDSSPQDDKIPNGAAPRHASPIKRNVNHNVASKIRYRSSTADNEVADSAHSTESSYIPHRSLNNSESHSGAHTSNGYSSGVTSRTQFDKTSQQVYNDSILKNRNFSYNDMPSAPPIRSGAETERATVKITTSGDNGVFYSAKMNSVPTTNKSMSLNYFHSSHTVLDGTTNETPISSERSAAGKEVNASSSSLPARVPTFYASTQGPWYAVISYDACVRLCLHSWAKGCTEEAPYFLNNECESLRNSFGLQHVLLQPEEELLEKQSSEVVSQGAAPKSKRTFGKMKVQVRKVKMGLDPPAGCSFSSLNPSMIKLESVRQHLSTLNSTLHFGWVAVRKVRVTPNIPPNGSLSQQSLAYMRASTQYIKQVSRLLRSEMTTLRNSPSSYEAVQETHTCSLRLKSSSEEDTVRMQPGSGETHIFFPDNQNDELIIEVQDSKGKYCGRVVAQVAAIADDPVRQFFLSALKFYKADSAPGVLNGDLMQSDKLRWWSMYHEPEHELIGRVQLFINYSTTLDESSQPKCGCVAETVAYDFVLEVAMKVQHFQQRRLLLHGPWKWLVTEFASYYGVSDAYTKLRYLSYVMDVATPTKDCLDLVYDLLHPVIMKGARKSVLSHQENRILGEVEDQIEQIFSLVFENYKSLDELAPSGMMDTFGPATGLAAPALAPAVKLYTLLHDVLSSEVQLKFCRYFQAAAKKRSRRHVAETDEFINSVEGTLMDPVMVSTSYQKMKSLILSVRNEICTDIQIHNQNVLPSFIDLPNLCASIYSADLSSRLRTFLVACPPPGPSPPVSELVIATADFQMDLASWNINSAKGGVDAKELFHSYITLWIQDKRLSLLELCKLDKVKFSGVKTQDSTTPFVDEMYERLMDTLNEYEVIVSRWPEYLVVLENAIADVEKAIIESLDKQYADFLSPLKDVLGPKIFGLKYVQKLAKRTGELYVVPDELGILLNSMKRMLDVLRPKVETWIKSRLSCTPNGVDTGAGECLSEVTVLLRSKFRNYLQAIVEKLKENTKIQNATKLKSIIQESKETMVESDLRNRMQPLKDLLIKTIDHVYSVVEPHVFISICRGFWDHMGQEILQFLQNRKDNRSWYKGSRIAVSILDDIFASQMQQLLGNSLQEKDLEPPRSIMEARSVLCKDAVNHQDNNYYY